MTLDQVVEVVERYRHRLHRQKIEPVQQNVHLPHPSAHNALKHAAWMCDEILSQVKNGDDVQKIMRWLGFLQAIFWLTGMATIQSLKDDNR